MCILGILFNKLRIQEIGPPSVVVSPVSIHVRLFSNRVLLFAKLRFINNPHFGGVHSLLVLCSSQTCKTTTLFMNDCSYKSLANL